MRSAQQLDIANEASSIAEVIEAANGEATRIRQDNGNTLTINAHAAMTPYIEKGDQVIFMVSNGSAVVLDRLRRPGELPVKTFTEQDDHLLLETNKHILLKSLNSTIALTADGNLTLSAENILTLAEALCMIKGKSVEIN